MKRPLSVLVFLLSGLIICVPAPARAQGGAKIYYVSTTGSDANSGLTVDLAFKTISKAASVMVAGDQCLIRQGIYRETVKPTGTGTSTAPLTFQAYGNDSVYISGADPITGWTLHSGSIYKAPMPWNLSRYKNQIIVDGKMAWAARSPDVDDNYVPNPYLLWCAGSFGLTDRRKWQTLTEPVAIPQRVCFGNVNSTGYGQVGSPLNYNLTDDGNAAYKAPPELFNRPADFFKGGLLTVQNIYWIGTGLITSSTSTATQTIFNSGRINPMSQEGSAAGWISHLLGLLDAPNEWYLDSAAQTLYLWAPDGGNPSAHLVEAKRRGLGFDLTGKQYIQVRNLRFIATSMTLNNAQNCLVEGCQFKYVSHDDVPSKDEMGTYYQIKQDCSDGHLGVYISGRNNIMRKCLIRGSAASGIVVSGKYDTVTNCIVTACDYSTTYHAGITVIANNGDWTAPNMPEGIDINRCYFAFNSRASIQVGTHANGDNSTVRLKIHNNNFAQSNYGSGESGQIAAQSCQKGEIFNNVFHDVAWIQSASIVTESDFGAQHWIIHHNVFYQGDSAVIWPEIGKPIMLRCSDWTFDANDTAAKCFNNTIVDSTVPLHKDWETMASFQGQPWKVLNKNNLWVMCDTARWMFTNPRKRDYTLRAGSPAIDKGEVIPGFVDTYNGSAPDLGAYESGQTPWAAGPDWVETPWSYPPQGPVAILPSSYLSKESAPTLIRTAGKFIVRAPRESRISIFDARGTLMRQSTVGRDGVGTIDRSALPAGMYFMRLSGPQGIFVWRLMAR
jgi:hypothetical protein